MWHVFGKQKDYVGNAMTDTFWINLVVINTLYSNNNNNNNNNNLLLIVRLLHWEMLTGALQRKITKSRKT